MDFHDDSSGVGPARRRAGWRPIALQSYPRQFQTRHPRKMTGVEREQFTSIAEHAGSNLADVHDA